jgi:hypothetical protein
LNPGNRFLENVPPAVAIVNETGECECTCGSSADSKAGASFIILLPIIIGFIWWIRMRKIQK